MWKTFRIVVESYSTVRTPIDVIFPGFPEVFMLNKDMSFFDEVCDVCKFPQTDSEYTCKGCKSAGKRGRPANHDRTIGCRFGRCSCSKADLADVDDEVPTDLQLPVKLETFDFDAPETHDTNGSPDPPVHVNVEPDDASSTSDEHFVDQEDTHADVTALAEPSDLPPELQEDSGSNASGGALEQDSASDEVDEPDFMVSDAPSRPAQQYSRTSFSNRAQRVTDNARPTFFPHRGFVLRGGDAVGDDDAPFESDFFSSSPFMYIHRVVSKNDPLYDCIDAKKARQQEWDKILEFEALDMKNPFEKADLLRRGKTVIRPLMLTTLKDFGTADEKFKGRFAADGSRAERTRRFGSPIDLASKRLLDFFMFTKGSSEKGVATADLTNGYLHASCKQEIYLEIPEEYRTLAMSEFNQPCVRILKALYGLPEAGFDFFEFVKQHLLNEGWKTL